MNIEIFDGQSAQRGYELNKMCFSLNRPENREAFRRDEAAYCRAFHMTDAQTQAVRSRKVLAMLEAGGNVYYLAKLAGVLGLSVQDIGAQQTGVSVEEFKRRLLAHGDH